MADPNIALNKPTKASSFVMPYSPGKAVNGVITPLSRWLSNTVPATMVVDLGSVNVITAWTVRHMGAAGWEASNYNMVDFQLQGSKDNITWATIDSVINNTYTVTTRSVIAAYRYVRLVVTKGLRSNPQLASVMELEINGHPVTANLSSLSISNNTLSPAFNPDILNYTAQNVPYTTSNVTVYATAADPTSVIEVNGIVMTGGHSLVNLNEGINIINVVVKAIDGVTKKNYSIEITREPGAILTNLTISSGTLTPDFSSNHLNYITQMVSYDTASVEVTPTTNVAGTTITVAGKAANSGQPTTVALNVGLNIIDIVAKKDNASQTYTIETVRDRSPYLRSVNGIPGITFVKTTYTYTTSTISPKLKNVEIVPEDTAAVLAITMNGISIPYTPSITFDLNSGMNILIISCTSASGVDKRTYTFNINKV